jgi:hypothetical protein
MLKTLREEMDDLARMSVEDTEQGEASFQKLYLLKPDETIMAALNVGPGRNIAYVARKLVYDHQPSMAVLETEGWTVAWDLPRSDPVWRKVQRGEIAPSDLPPDKRGESLIMYAESAEGEVLHRMWKIVPTADGKRRVEPWEIPANADVHHVSRFTPLFIVEDLERLIDNELSLGEVQARSLRPRSSNEALMDKEMLTVLRGLVQELPRAERRLILRHVVGETMFGGEAPLIEVTPIADRRN